MCVPDGMGREHMVIDLEADFEGDSEECGRLFSSVGGTGARD